MPLYSALLDIMKSEADVTNTRANAGLLTAQTQALQQKAAADEAMRQAMQGFDAAQIAAGAPTEEDTEGFGQSPRYKSVQNTINLANQDVQMQRALAAVARRAGNYTLAEKHDDDARQSMANVQAGQLRLQEERKLLMKDLASTAGSASQETFPQVKAQLDALVPGWSKRVKTNIDAEGMPVWGPQTEAAMEQIAKRGMTSFQQADIGIKVANAEFKDQELAFKVDKEARQKQDAANRDRRQREGIAVRWASVNERIAEGKRRDARYMETQDYRDAVVEERVLARQQRQADVINRDLGKEYPIEQLGKYEVANQTAMDVWDTLEKSGPRGVTQQQALSVRDALRSTNVQFKARSGDKFSSQQLREAQGILQKAEAYWGSIGQGNLRPDKETLQNEIRQINTAYSIVMEDATKATLRAQERAAKRGIDPSDVQGRGDVDALVRAGRAKRVNVNGEELILFGPAIADPGKATPGETVFAVPKVVKRKNARAPKRSFVAPADDDDEDE